MKKITLIDTCYNDYDYADVKDFCEMNEMEIPAENSDEDYEIRREMRDMDVEYFWDNIKYSKNLGYCIVTGKLGLWNGTFDIEPKVFKTLYDAFSACAEDYNFVEQDHSTFIFEAVHHDGRNVFEIKLLNDKGIDAWREGRKVDLTNRRYHKTLKDYVA